MWMTPIEVISTLDTKVSDKTMLDAKFLSNLESSVMDLHMLFKTTQNNIALEATESDSFYMFQQSLFISSRQCQGKESNKNMCSKEHQAISLMNSLIRLLFTKSISAYLQELYVSSDFPIDEASSSRVFVWASVHANGSYHRSHYHKNSMVSGVFYVRTPPGSGDIVFHDPRGSLPPFGKSLHITPQVGDLVLFPGWLTHEVEPPSVVTTQPRISISFNMEGPWDTTADINVGYHV
jgi:hypothetical protein